MSTYHLVIVDTVGIQRYIFGSNRLRENVGASHLVYQATRGWLLESPGSLLSDMRHNIVDGNTKSDTGREIDSKLRIERGAVDAELIYAGGGNTVLIFREAEQARTFSRNLSKRLLQEAPGLEAVVVHRAFRWAGTEEDEPLAHVFKAAFADLQKKKERRTEDQPLLGLGVTAACQSTGLVANRLEWEPGEENTLLSISEEVFAKWQANGPAKTRLKQLYDAAPYDYPDQFDHLGRAKGESSYLGVVHADGNRIGRILEGITEEYCQKSSAENRAYIDTLRQFSREARNIGTKALTKVLEAVAEWNKRGDADGSTTGVTKQGIALQPHNMQPNHSYLSIRPIVFGGDDVTFVCDGRIALQAAQVFLQAFEQEDVLGKRCKAAGVAIVKVRYPFARAYALAEALTKNAKEEYERKESALDWHLTQAGLFGSLGDIRKREYGSDGRTLLMRPLALNTENIKSFDEWRTWQNFTSLLSTFRSRDEWPRSRVMALRSTLQESLHQGTAPVEALTSIYRELLSVDNIREMGYRQTGWTGNRCIYFDAIEMLDQLVEPQAELGQEETEREKEAV